MPGSQRNLYRQAFLPPGQNHQCSAVMVVYEFLFWLLKDAGKKRLEMPRHEPEPGLLIGNTEMLHTVVLRVGNKQVASLADADLAWVV